MSLETGIRLDHYDVRRRLGEGGMGELFRAHDQRLDRDAVIQVLPEEVTR
jgi:serine/threonine protein kinase